MDTSPFDNPLNGLIADDQAPAKEAAAVQHCLVYLSAELRKLGLAQAARLVDDAVRQVSDAQRFCVAERDYFDDMPRRRPPSGANDRQRNTASGANDSAAYMVPGE